MSEKLTEVSPLITKRRFSNVVNKIEIEDFEINLLLQAVLFRYGYDFHHYARASITRRINNCMRKTALNNISDLIAKILHEVDFFELFLKEMSVTVTEMFRDPKVFNTLRQQVFTQLKTYSRVNIWHAGCATGEEVYSVAIMLKEEGLLSRCRIYATDFNNHSLNIAEEAIYPAEKMAGFTHNYLLSGGKASFADYYQAKHSHAKMHSSLKEHITFANHNLMKDQSFAKMHLIICRNVLIYFDQVLQNQVLNIFQQSLLHRGYLLLGDKESLDFSEQSKNFICIAKKEKIYQKINYD